MFFNWMRSFTVFFVCLVIPSFADYAYVANFDSGSVSVIDTCSYSVIQTISVGSFPRGVAVTPDNRYVYVTNSGSNTVSVIDATTNTVIQTISGFNGPQAIAITPLAISGKYYAYVANEGSDAGDTVSVIDTSNNTIADTIVVGNSPNGVAITPDGNYVYVTNAYYANTSPYVDGTVSVISTSSNTVVQTIAIAPAGSWPYGIAITPDGASAYVVNSGEDPGTICMINTSTYAIDATITLPQPFDPVGAYPSGIAITPNGHYAYIADYGSGYDEFPSEPNVYVIDTNPLSSTYNTITDSIILSNRGPIQDAVTSDGQYVYATSYGSFEQNGNTVSVINTNTNTVEHVIFVGSKPVGIAFVKGPMEALFTVTPPSGGISTDFSFSATPCGGVGPYTYVWDFGDGGTATGPTSTHRYSEDGDYTVQLTITDSHSTQALSTQDLIVDDLTASFIVSPPSGHVDTTFSFTASASQGIPPYSYYWDFGDALGTATGASATYRYASDGNYTVQLTVIDSASIAVYPSQLLSVSTLDATFTITPASGNVGILFSFSAAASLGTPPYTYSWEFGDGETATGASATHVYSSEGDYTVQLMVVDGASDEAFVSQTLDVALAAIQPPMELIGKQKVNDFDLQYELYNILRWKPSPSSGVAGYYVYRNGVKIATLKASVTVYKDHDRKRGRSTFYSVTAFDSQGNESSAATIIVKK